MRPPKEKGSLLQALVYKYCTLRGWEYDHLAAKSKIGRTTLYSRVKNPGSCTVDEINAICAAQRWTTEDKLDLIENLFRLDLSGRAEGRRYRE